MRQDPQPRPQYPSLIARCRRAAGLSRAELAERTSVTVAMIELWESPTYQGIDLSILQRIAAATGTELVLDFRAREAAPLPAPEPAATSTSGSAASDLLAPEAPPSKARTRTWLELIEPQVA
ncbi:MAG: helix-turn-helix transcriptional regulator [Planctomycetota bacterium]|jgi:transcriptional regulator with XRE-family HTH domain